MDQGSFSYIIVGGGLAGASAAEGIREKDHDGSILLFTDEEYLPYHRPPLSKKLWLGKQQVDEIYVHDDKYYAQHNVRLALNTKVVILEPDKKRVMDSEGQIYHFQKLLLATGAAPRRLPIPGGELEGVNYFRGLNDYVRLKAAAKPGTSAVVIGGGFIGSEIAAALVQNRIQVTMVFPEPYLCNRLFPESLGRALLRTFQDKGVEVHSQDKPVLFSRQGQKFVVQTEKNLKLEADLLVVGAGVRPNIGLAENAKLEIQDGIAVNEFLQTSHPDIYAAGDNAWFPYPALDKSLRLEHWDHALNQGKAAGRNMAGAGEAYQYQPYFFSDLFEFGYEATGEIDSRLETTARWEKENEKGIVYYLRDRKIRGVLLCNVWGKVDEARNLIRMQKELVSVA